MKTIKFRIFNPEDMCWVESGGTPTMLAQFFNYTARFHTYYGMPYLQYIGMKDKNGVEIYEEDIVEVEVEGWEEEDKFSMEVKRSQLGYFADNECGFDYYPPLDSDLLSVEVVGNTNQILHKREGV